MWRLVVVCACLLCLGFEWPGRVHRLQYELKHAETPRRREVARQLAAYPAAQVREPLLLALEDDDPGVRLEAAASAGKVRLREAVPILLDWLDEKEVDTRAAAARALGRIGEPRAQGPLVRALGDADAQVRAAALAALARMGSDQAVVPLAGRLDDPDLTIRLAAIEALGRLGDPAAVAPLLGRSGDPAPEVREAVIAALGRLGDARAVPAVTRALQDASAEVRLAAVAALSRLGDVRAVRPLRAQLPTAEAREAKAIVAALGGLDDDDARAALLAQLSQPPLRDAAVLALAAHGRMLAQTPSGEGAAGERLSKLVSELARIATGATQTDTRLAAARALDAIAEAGSIEASVQPLLEALPDAEPPLRAALLQTLARSGSPQALMPLLTELAQAEGEALDRALDALHAHFQRNEPDGRAADPLLARLEVASPLQRAKIVELLGRTGAARALPAIRPFLSHEDETLQLSAVEAFRRIGDGEAAPELLTLLDARRARTRWEAARALGKLAGPKELRAVLERLQGEQAADRHALLIALGAGLARLARDGQLPAELAEDARGLLESYLEHRDRRLADRALAALARWHPPEALKAVALRLRSPSERRRTSASFALGQFTGEEARTLLRYVMRDGAGRTVTAAVAGLGELGDERDLAALVRATERQHWPVPGAATYAIARMAQRGVLKERLTQRKLCQVGQSREPFVRANVAAAMARLNAGPCPARQGEHAPHPLRWLEPAHAEVVRAAAARWTHAALKAGRLPEAEARAALEHCAASDLEPSVRAACAAPELPSATEDAEVYAYASDGTTLLRDRLVGLRLADGSVFLGYTDSNGYLYLKNIPKGELLLDDPGRIPLEQR